MGFKNRRSNELLSTARTPVIFRAGMRSLEDARSVRTIVFLSCLLLTCAQEMVAGARWIQQPFGVEELCQGHQHRLLNENRPSLCLVEGIYVATNSS